MIETKQWNNSLRNERRFDCLVVKPTFLPRNGFTFDKEGIIIDLLMIIQNLQTLP